MPTAQSFPVRLLQLCTTLLASSSTFLTAFNALNSDVFSDPKLNFVVSQAILEHGTIYLNPQPAPLTWPNELCGHTVQEGSAFSCPRAAVQT